MTMLVGVLPLRDVARHLTVCSRKSLKPLGPVYIDANYVSGSVTLACTLLNSLLNSMISTSAIHVDQLKNHGRWDASLHKTANSSTPVWNILAKTSNYGHRCAPSTNRLPR